MIAIFSTQDSARLRFALDFVFRQYFASGYQLFHNEEEFSSHENYKINYSSVSLNANLQIIPAKEIFEKDLKVFETNCFEWKGTKAFFGTSDNEIPFDIFFAVFYLLSRYEEYLPHQKDKHQIFYMNRLLIFGYIILPEF